MKKFIAVFAILAVMMVGLATPANAATARWTLAKCQYVYTVDTVKVCTKVKYYKHGSTRISVSRVYAWWTPAKYARDIDNLKVYTAGKWRSYGHNLPRYTQRVTPGPITRNKNCWVKGTLDGPFFNNADFIHFHVCK